MGVECVNYWSASSRQHRQRLMAKVTWSILALLIMMAASASNPIPSRALQGTYSRVPGPPGHIDPLSRGCVAVGMLPITDQGDCKSAAISLSLSDHTVRTTDKYRRPEGCWYCPPCEADWRLMFSTNPRNAGRGGEQDIADQICRQATPSPATPAPATPPPATPAPATPPPATPAPVPTNQLATSINLQAPSHASSGTASSANSMSESFLPAKFLAVFSVVSMLTWV